MKRSLILCSISLAAGLLFPATLSAQPSRGRLTQTEKTVEAEKPTGTATTLPTVDMSRNRPATPRSVNADKITWHRDVYRILDLTKEKNAPLYFPPQPDGNRQNLFSLLFGKVLQGELTVYDYLDGKEVFTEEYHVDVEELLNRFWIPFEAKPKPKSPKDTIYQVETADIPSNEVSLYYIKEAYFLDETTSSIRRKSICICPVMVREDEMGETRKYPLFWVPLDDIRGLLATQTVNISSYNAASRMSLYDYFNSHFYQGDIYKVYNLQNQNIMDYCTTPDEIAAEQARLEKELADMCNGLWEESQKDAIARQQAENGDSGKSGKKRSR